MTDKPPYRVPSMEEIRALPWNGFNAVSSFSGCGGSSLGYRMAGFRTLWASEFVPAAQETYRANAAPYTVLDTRDAREVKGQDILDATGLGVGEIDLFDGSPPCASFSTAGKREAGWGQVKKYSDTEQRTDDLFFEYARLIEETQPRVFVAENVAGLVKGTAKGYFKLILARLKACGYQVQARVLNASWLGVPQSRNRLIFIGVREDLGMDPVHPAPLPYQYTVRDALPWILAQGYPGVKHGQGHIRASDHPSPTILSSPNNGNEPDGYPARVIAEPRFIHDTRGHPSFSAGDVTDRPCPAVLAHSADPGHYQIHGGEQVTHDSETGKSLAIGGRSARPDVRKMTLSELRQVGGFPADFQLTGTYEQRWERIGRAVPPVMMSHIAATVRDRILVPLREAGTV